jgi:HPt (histidine-containing phosphotransfer) domain-containing protein
LVFDNGILDLSRLREAFEDDTDGIVELLDMALNTGERHVTTMTAGLENGDATAVARSAHSIKGSASNIGALRIPAIAEAIEESVRAQSWSDIKRLAGDLHAAYGQLREAIASYRAEVALQRR